MTYGIGSLPSINPLHKAKLNYAMAGVGASVLAVLSPFESAKIIGATVLTGVGYGIANDMFACRDCIEYFTVGHHYDGEKLRGRLLFTLDPNWNALAWGAFATWHVCTIAGIVLAFISRTPFRGLKSKITAKTLAPKLVVGALLLIVKSHFAARAAQKAYENKGKRYFFWGVPEEFQSRWNACHVRNLTGYLGLAVGGVALSVAIIASRAGLYKL
ncbi:MAG: hypothetical protein SP4CHLAM5_02030 [Chlamydiia bacterium]|nr:hypothetical protein [Chlamydiia bacterium]MCH9618077.1 hypothetical protein [Chlamydiia bacterium]MCH9624203.1 hypothetical protein [Chlamydiia bacterium]